ncbi:MAG: N-acetylmuramoyl-L-alanine amidase [Rhodocyclaceae bacterium]|jgi:N-acetylmuramoyl-L-alanine amidase|nr:N-acetylmuramoyl-L-alanine amidase [Rhodocyclaceae bacterium]
MPCLPHAPLALLLAALIAGGSGAAPAAPRVAVDVGHTLAASGARSARGRSEFEFNLALARTLADNLARRGMGVTLINADGGIQSLAARPVQAEGADLLVSIHHDSVGQDELLPWQWQGRDLDYNDRWQGHSLFVSGRNPWPRESLLCASAMGARLQREGFTPTDKNARHRPWADQADTVHWYDNLVVLRLARQPAVLVEAGVIKHRQEELLLADPARQARMADALATGIAACLQVLDWERRSEPRG